MTATTKVNYKTKCMVIVELANLKAPQAIEKLNQAHNEIASFPPKSVLLVTDVTNTEITNEFIAAITEFAKKNTPYVKSSAAVGANTLVKIISYNVANTAGRKINSFNTRTEAMDWLATQP